MRVYKFRLILILIFYFIGYVNLCSKDITEPRSFQQSIFGLMKQENEIQSYISMKPNKDSLIFKEMKINEDGKPRPQLYGWGYNVNFNTSNNGTWDTLLNGDRIWRLNIECPEAFSINLVFDNFSLSDSCDIFIYNNERDMIVGPLTSKNNKNHGKFATHLIKGESITIEYFEPRDEFNKSKFNLTRVVYGFIDAFSDFESIKNDNNADKFQSSSSCNRDVNCPEGDDWCREKNSVSLILVTLNGNEYSWCSGSLLNNTQNNYHPYLLTAFHCIDYLDDNGLIDQSEINWLDTWVFRFGNFKEGCNIGSGMPTFDYSGADFVSGWSTSDFLLLELEEQPSSGENNFQDVYFNGWDRSGVVPNTVTGIHHPNGDLMKISESYTTPNIVDNNTHWDVDWTTGTTEGGSSGSPLYNPDKQVIGQVHYGIYPPGHLFEYCHPDKRTTYGMFSVSWLGDGTDATSLHHWLDPDDPTGLNSPQTLDGIKMPLLKYGMNTGNGQTLQKNAFSQMRVGSSSTSQFIVHSGGNLTLKAGKEIVIRPCTAILSGSVFRAHIEDLDCSDLVMLSDTESEYDASICSSQNPPLAKQVSSIKYNLYNQTNIKITPNPFTVDTRISISLSSPDIITLTVYDILGNQIATLADGEALSAGSHNFSFSGQNINSGVYYVVMSSSTERISRPLMLIK
jgi:hypothetical protein